MSALLPTRPPYGPALVLALVGSGCAEGLPDVRLIEGTRPLAVRVDVSDQLAPDQDPDAAPRCQALPFETVTLTPFVVDPQGPLAPDTIDPAWIACQLNPGQGLFGCISAAFPTKLDEIPDCEPPDLGALQSGEIPVAVSPCVVGRTGTPSFVVPLNSSVLVGGDIEITMIAGTPGGSSTDACARALLAGEHEIPDDCVLVLQRVELGPLDALLLLAQDMGIDLGGLEPPDPDDVPDYDRNPRLSRFQVAVVGADGEAGELVEVGRGDTVTASMGDTLRVEVSVPEQDLQMFLEPLNQTETQPATETIEGDLYRSWGRFLGGSFDDLESYDEWTLEPDADQPVRPPDDVATLFVTLRDDRTGVDWWWFHVDVSE